ncbi:PQQ-binding-like beta-propeller repeat protein [Spirillospora sp. CA-255316]
METLRPGDPRRVGGHRLLGRLGSGGMGQVYLGRSPGGLQVAVKVVHPHLAEDPDFRRRFRRETAAARSVGGAFTAPVVDADPEADPPWLATAYLPGLPLHEVVAAHGPLPPAAVLALGAGLAEALVSIHRAGVVHRDLKPANVILGLDGPRVIDFGIAHAAEGSLVTRAGSALGSPGFIAPEQARGEPTGPAADVFALGAVLVYAATGTGPYGDGPPHLLIYRAVHEHPRLDAVTDPSLRAIAADCLGADPAARPAPARLLERLAPLVPDEADLRGLGWLPEPVAAGIARAGAATPANEAGATRPYEAGFLAPTRRRVLLLGGAGAVAAIAAGTGAAAVLRPEEKPAQPARNRPAAAPAPSSPPPVGQGKLLWRRYTGSEYLMSSPAVAGGAVFIGSEKGDLLAFDARTGKPRWKYSTGTRIISWPAVDGGVVYVGGEDGNVHAVDTGTGRARWRRQVGATGTGTNTLVAGGLVFAGDDPVRALDAADGSPRWQSRGGTRYVSHRTVADGVLYVPRSKSLAALDASTGRLRWEYGMSKGSGGAAVSGGVVYCGDFQGNQVHAFSARDAEPRWKYRTTGAVTARPQVSGGRVYVGDRNSNVLALDAATGTMRWQAQIDGHVQGDPALAGGMLYVAAGIYSDGVLYAIEAATGRQVWRFEVEEGTESSPVVAGGIVYFGAKDGYLYALATSGGPGTVPPPG